MSSTDGVKRKAPRERGARSLRSKLAEQIQCLQRKHTAEMDVLDDVRNFLKQKAELDKEYSQGLLKLTQAHMQKRKKVAPPIIEGYDKSQHKGVVEVWSTILEVTADLATRRKKMADEVLDGVADDIKQYKKMKDSVFKKQFELGQKMDSEVLEEVKDMGKSKKSYHDLEKVTTDSRQKYMDVESRWKKKEMKLFESSSGLEKTYNRASERLKECQKKSTVARNEYLLSLAATNAHLEKFYKEDLVELMRVMDGPFYEKMQYYYKSFAQSEVDLSKFALSQFEDLRRNSQLVSRDYVVSCFLHKFTVFTDVQEYPFDPYGQDQVCALSRDHGAEIYLDKHARKWARDLVQEEQLVLDRNKAIRGVRSVSVAYSKNPEFGTSEATSEAELRIEQLQDDVRRSLVEQATLSARLELLRQGGIDVDKWLAKANDSCKPKTLLEISKAPSRANSSTLGSLDNLLDLDKSDNTDPFDTLSLASTGSSQSQGAPKSCTALYCYTGRHQDELSIVEGEVLDVMEWDDGEGWTKGRNKLGEEGYFPQNYVQPLVLSRPATPPKTNGLSNNMLEQTDNSPILTPKNPSNVPGTGVELLRALYSYDALTEEELSFQEGAIIELLRTDDNGVDDGWWEGRYLGKVGVFPSLLVERLSESTDGTHTCNYSTASSEADSTSPPPPSVPPPPLPQDLDSTLTDDTTPTAKHPPTFGLYDSFDEEDDIDGLV